MNGFLKSGAFVQNKYTKLLIAGVLSWFVSLIDSCADTFIAGIFINDAAVSGIELISPVFSILSFVAYLICMGSALMYSREAGAFHHEKANKIVGQGVICAGIAAVVLVAAMILVRDPLLAFYGPSAEVAGYALEYYQYQLVFALLYPIFYLIQQLVIIDGDEKIAVLGTVTMAGCNLIASLLLVDSMGVRGLALGTVIGAVCGFLTYFAHFFKKTNSIHIKFQFVPKDIAEMVKLSSTTSFTLLYIAIIDIVMNKFVIQVFSDAYLTAYAVINLALNVAAIFASVYDAASGFISIGYGEQNPKSIERTMKIAVKAALIESLVMTVTLIVLAPYIPSIYGITDSEVAAAAVFAARVIAVSSPATALYYLFSSYYPSTNRVVMGNLLTAAYMLVTPIAFALPLALTPLGFNGMSIGFALTSVATVLITLLFIRIRYGKKANPLLLPESEEESLCYDLSLSQESIFALCEKVKEELTRRNLPDNVINEVQLILEESYMTILEKNAGRKVLSECNLLVSTDHLRMFTRDNGRIFDLTDTDAKVKNFRSYVLARLMEHNTERAHLTTISFNRNSYLWHLKEAN